MMIVKGLGSLAKSQEASRETIVTLGSQIEALAEAHDESTKTNILLAGQFENLAISHEAERSDGHEIYEIMTMVTKTPSPTHTLLTL
jgi:hypothetical protein